MTTAFTVEYTPARGPRPRIRYEPRADGAGHWRIDAVWHAYGRRLDGPGTRPKWSLPAARRTRSETLARAAGLEPVTGRGRAPFTRVTPGGWQSVQDPEFENGVTRAARPGGGAVHRSSTAQRTHSITPTTHEAAGTAATFGQTPPNANGETVDTRPLPREVACGAPVDDCPLAICGAHALTATPGRSSAPR
jgi:hypothetical protein